MSSKPMCLHHHYKDIGRVHRTAAYMNARMDGFYYYVERIITETGEADVHELNPRKLKTKYYHWRIKRVPRD